VRPLQRLKDRRDRNPIDAGCQAESTAGSPLDFYEASPYQLAAYPGQEGPRNAQPLGDLPPRDPTRIGRSPQVQVNQHLQRILGRPLPIHGTVGPNGPPAWGTIPSCILCNHQALVCEKITHFRVSGTSGRAVLQCPFYRLLSFSGAGGTGLSGRRATFGTGLAPSSFRTSLRPRPLPGWRFQRHPSPLFFLGNLLAFRRRSRHCIDLRVVKVHRDQLYDVKRYLTGHL